MIHAEHRGAVAILTIDRPERRNAVDLDAVRAIQAGVDRALNDPSVRVLLLAGAGGNFCAGADLDTVTDTEFLSALNRVLDALRQCPLPTIAAVEGVALGAGTQFAVACDLRVATPDARFGIPASKLGLLVHHWTVHRLASLAGQGTSRAMLLAAETVSGQRAYELGLVQRLGGLADAIDWANDIASLAPLSLRGHKLGLNLSELEPPTTQEYRRAFEQAWASADLQEGLAAFRERRRPRFRGE